MFELLKFKPSISSQRPYVQVTVILCTETIENTEIHVGVIYMSDTWKDYV